jgi:hypothetical protein
MNEAKHTPGPWAWNDIAYCWLEGGDGTTILHVDDGENTCPFRSDANACLIAAAPELLEALHGALNNATGMAAYLATCATPTILENLETTIAALHREAAKYEAAIRKARGIAV